MTALAVARTGTGPPLLLLHRLGLTRDSWGPAVSATWWAVGSPSSSPPSGRWRR